MSPSLPFDRANWLTRLLQGETLSANESSSLFSEIVAGNVSDVCLAAMITAIQIRGAAVDELVGGATALLNSARPFPVQSGPFGDIVGTGGDGQQTINVSTLAAFVTATAGCPIVKHGNRSVTSPSGAFDLLENLGLPLELPPEQSAQMLREHGICFLFAPYYHPGLRHAAQVRRELRTRSIFNLLGPLVNPARPSRILLGVARVELMEPMANALQQLNFRHALVVCGSGMDEVAVHAPTLVIECKNGQRQSYTLVPEDFGSAKFPLQQIQISTAREGHERGGRILQGSGTDAENAAVCLNSALAQRLFSRDDLRQNFRQSLEALKTGAVSRRLAAIIGKGSP